MLEGLGKILKAFLKKKNFNFFKKTRFFFFDPGPVCHFDREIDYDQSNQISQNVQKTDFLKKKF